MSFWTDLVCRIRGSAHVSKVFCKVIKSLCAEVTVTHASSAQTCAPGEFTGFKMVRGQKWLIEWEKLTFFTKKLNNVLGMTEMTFLMKRVMFRPLKQRGCFWMDEPFLEENFKNYVFPFMGTRTASPRGRYGERPQRDSVWRYICKNTTCWPATAHDVTI